MKVGSFLRASALIVAMLAAGEVAARVDDWIRLRVPFNHTPDELIDLRTFDSLGTHGKPYGRYHGYRLNNFGFRSAEMSATPAPGCTRIMVLGASETFGYYETPGKEYPAQLQDSVRSHGCYEVINAGIPGSTARALVSFWERYASRFGAKVVLVYPTPIFYLGVNALPPQQPFKAPDPNAAQPVAPWRPRLLERLHNVLHTPDFIQIRRERKWIEEDTRGKPDSWFFREPPQDRLIAYQKDLDSLVKTIRASGATPVMMTHAMPFTTPAQPADDFLLVAWRHVAPRATSAAMLDFEHAASRRIRESAAEQHVPVVDIDSALTGKSAFFGDFTHFTNDGAAVVAGVITQTLVRDGLIGPSASGGITRKPDAAPFK